MQTRVHMQYSNWGITVIGPWQDGYCFGAVLGRYPYAVGARGPVNDANAERKAIDHCRSLNGVVKGPFFYRE